MDAETDSGSRMVRSSSIAFSATGTSNHVGGSLDHNDHQLPKTRRSMMRRQESTKSTSNGFNSNNNNSNNDKGKLEKTKSRRMGQVNQDIKIIEITRQARTNDKKKMPNTSEIFKFECEGDIITPLQGMKKHVKWHATFDKPIEQLIYPSLQRFDNESYQEKRKVFRQLHGGAMEGSAIKSNIPLTVPSPAHPPLPQKSPKSSKQQQQQQPQQQQQQQQQQQMTYSFSENHGIKIDILPEAMAVSSDFMFIHTPKWTVDVTDVKPISPKVPLSANIEDDEENQEENNGALTSRSHRKIRASLIRKQINKEKKRRKKAKRQKKSSLDRMRVLTRDEDGNDNDSYASSYDDDDDFDDDDEDADNYSRGGGGGRSSKSSSLISKTTLLEEIETEGEKYLRKQIKDHYELKKEEDKLLQLEKNETMSPFHELKLSLQRKKDKLPPLVHNPADNLYAQLVNRHNLSKYGTSSSTSDHAMTPVSKLHKLSDLTSEEVAFNEQSKALKKIIPQESDYLMDGVLYYRIQNQLHNSQLQQLQAIEQRKMVVQPKKLSRRYSNYFSQRLSSRKSSEMNQTISEIHLSRNEDPHLVKSTDIQYLDDIHEMHFHRFNRAVENKFHGFTELENEKDLQYLTNTSNRIEQQRPQNRFNNSSAFARPMSASTPKGNEKPNVMSKFAGQRGSTTNQASLDNAQRETEALMSAERSKRKAQDLLLLNQLEAGVLPETFIKASEDPRFITINLSQYGIGDVRGLCLGKCLKALDRLQSIGLTDNRLTSLSLPTIINNLNYATVMDLDLSFNQVHDQGAKALANHFKYTNNVLRFLDISNCSIKSSDIKILCDILKIYPNQLEEFYLSGNNITEDGAIDLCAYLSSRTCNLNILDLSWNHIGELGAIEFSHAMKINKSLIKLNLASNSLNDKGGQRFIDSLADQNTLVEVNIAQNGISNGTCFVVSQVLKGHPSLRRLDLSLNPLGEAGARSIFRTILRGLSCFVIMRNSSYPENNNIFNHTYPMMDNPYHLDLSEPYKHAVVQELIMKYLNDPQHCYFENMTYKESIKSSEQSIHLSINSNGIVVNKATQEKWKVPKHGILKFHFHQEIFVPTIEHRIPDKDFQMLQIIIENGVTEIDKRTWLSLLCQDIYLTTNQAQEMIDRFKKNRTIGTGGLSVLDVLTSIWKVLLDTENMFDFLYANTDKNERRDLVYAITLKQYKFNWANPTSHWSLNLADKVQRAIMMQIIAINNSEAEFSQKHSGRGDTSQQGNWFNFRNVKYTLNRVTNDILIDKEFLINLPVNGTLDFDYVSTKRPPAELYQNNRKYKKGSKKIGSMDVNNMTIDTSEDEDMGPSRIMSAKANRDILTSPSTPANGLDPAFGGEHGGEDEYIIEDNLDFTSALKRPKSSSPMNSLIPLSVKSSRPVSSHTPKSQSGSEPNSSRIPFQSSNSNVPRKIKLITDDELYIFMQQLGLSNRSKISGSQTLFVLMDLQLASTKYFFTVANVLIILDAFEDDWEIQSRVIVALFSRIKDLHNIDILLRNLNMKGQQDIIKKLGYLNVINPLKISFDYVLSLKYLDNRILLIALMELAAIESADQISEEPNTELAIATLYGSYTRALNDVRPEVMRFSYADFGIRTTSISWATRREYIKKFLVGTQPLDEEIYQTISMYKELESHGALTRGPIDLQYATYLKQQKSTQARTVKMTKNMQNAMRNATKEAKK